MEKRSGLDGVVGDLPGDGICVCKHGNISEHRLHGKLHENNQRDFRGSSWETRERRSHRRQLRSERGSMVEKGVVGTRSKCVCVCVRVCERERVVSSVYQAKCGIATVMGTCTTLCVA